jgi:hypothetical protein
MRSFRPLTAGLVCLTLTVATARAEAPRSPLRLLPAEADLLVEVKQPRQLVETLTNLDLLKQLQQFSAFKEQLDSTRARRLFQLVAYFEKELGAKWPELLDRLAGGGAALGLNFEPNPVPSLLVVQGKEEELTRKFIKLLLEVVEQELARQEAKERPVKSMYNGVETIRLGDQLHLAVAGAAILVSNNAKALERGLDLHLGREKKSLTEVESVAESLKLLPKDPLINLWVKMEAIRQTPGGKEFYKKPREPQAVVFLGDFIDVLSRSPYAVAGLVRDKEGFLLTARVPRGRDGMGIEMPLHLPPPGQPASRPLLEPKGVIYSDSYYLDVARIWNDRGYLFGEKQAKALEDFDKTSARFLAGAKMSQLLTQAGPYLRTVVVNQPAVPYKNKPKIALPSFAVIAELREPEAFAKSVDSVFRAAALLAGFQVKLTLVEDKQGEVPIVGWRFAEDAPLKGDTSDIRYNFSPCFCRVGNQYVVCSTLELCHELVDLLEKEAKAKAKGESTKSRLKLFSAGAADILQVFEDQLVTQTVLAQAVPVDEARNQIKALIALVRGLGQFAIDVNCTDDEFHYDIRVTAPQK